MITRILLIAAVGFPCIAQDISMNSLQTSSMPVQTVVIKPIEQQIIDLESRNNNLSSFAVKGSVTINNKGKDTTLNAVVITTNDKTRIRISYGELLIVDYMVCGNNVEIYLPMKSVVFKGLRDDLIKLDSWFALLTSELCGYSLAFPSAWDANATQRRYIREKSTMVILASDSDVIKALKKVTFDKYDNEMVISNVYKYNNDGELKGMISFSDYKIIKDKLIPHKVLFSVSADTKITFNFNEIWINDTFDDKTIFSIKVPPEIKSLGVQELDKKDWL